MPTSWWARSGVLREPGLVSVGKEARVVQVAPSSSDPMTAVHSALAHFARPRANRCLPPALVIDTRSKLLGTGSGTVVDGVPEALEGERARRRQHRGSRRSRSRWPTRRPRCCWPGRRPGRCRVRARCPTPPRRPRRPPRRRRGRAASCGARGRRGLDDDRLPAVGAGGQVADVGALAGEEVGDGVALLPLAGQVGQVAVHRISPSIVAIRWRASNRSRLMVPSDFSSCRATVATGRSAK